MGATIWECGYCKSVQTSTDSISHQMDYCKCGLSAVDKEVHYSRTIGKVIIIKNIWDGESTAEQSGESKT